MNNKTLTELKQDFANGMHIKDMKIKYKTSAETIYKHCGNRKKDGKRGKIPIEERYSEEEKKKIMKELKFGLPKTKVAKKHGMMVVSLNKLIKTIENEKKNESSSDESIETDELLESISTDE